MVPRLIFHCRILKNNEFFFFNETTFEKRFVVVIDENYKDAKDDIPPLLCNIFVLQAIC